MRSLTRKLPTLGLAFILLLAACNPGTTTPSPTTAPPPTSASTAAPADPTADLSTPQPQPTGDPNEPVSVVAPDAPGTCTVQPLPELPVRPVDDTDWVTGASLQDAKIVLYEYADFQCPGCAGMYPIVTQFIQQHPDIALVYRSFPLDFHQYADITAQAAEAAGAQGKFWQMHDMLFEYSTQWSALASMDEVRAELTSYAKDLSLDVDAFNAALDDGTYADKVKSQYDEAIALNLPGTPSFIFDNILFPSDIGLSLGGLESFLTIVQSQDQIFFPDAPAMTITSDNTIEAVVKTSKGDLTVNLLPESAPANVNSFVFLAQQGWYDGSEFFYVRDNFVAVTGDPTNSTVGYPGYYCEGETQGTFDRPGLLGMLPNGQFFFTLGSDAAQLNGQFALVGQVVDGLDVLDQLVRVAVGDPSAPQADVVQSIEVTVQ